MSEERLRAAFEALPRERASHGFTARVLARLDEPETHPTPRPAGRFALAAALALVLGLALGLLWRQARPGPDPDIEAGIEQARLEYLSLRHELELLERSLEPPPVFYLGSDERMDVLLDPRGLVEPENDIQPAAWRY